MTSRKHRSRDRDRNIGAALRHHRIARGPIDTLSLDQLKNEIRALLKRDDWQHEDDGFYLRATLGELLMRAREIIEADVRQQPPVGKRKGGEGKVNQNWRRLLDACSTQPGYYIALSERHAKRFIADAKAARTGEGKSPKNEPVK